MSEASVAEAEIESSQAITPDSGASQETVLTQDALPAGTEEETHDTGAETRSAESYNLTELDHLYHEGKLAEPSLVDRRERQQQSQRDREENERLTLGRIQQEEAERLGSLNALRQETGAKLKALREQGMQRGWDEDVAVLLANEEARILDDYHNATAEVHLAPIEHNVRQALLRIEGSTVRRQAELNGLLLPDLINRLYRDAVEIGKRTPAEGYKSFPVSDFDEKGRHKPSYTAGQDDFKAANPGTGLPSTNGVRALPGQPYTLTQIDAMTTHEWMAIGDRDQRLAILDQAHEQAARDSARRR